MRKASDKKKITEVFREKVVFYDTTVPVEDLFQHLREGKSIRSFLKSYPAVEKEQVLQLLTQAEALIVAQFLNEKASK